MNKETMIETTKELISELIDNSRIELMDILKFGLELKLKVVEIYSMIISNPELINWELESVYPFLYIVNCMNIILDLLKTLNVEVE